MGRETTADRGTARPPDRRLRQSIKGLARQPGVLVRLYELRQGRLTTVNGRRWNGPRLPAASVGVSVTRCFPTRSLRRALTRPLKRTLFWPTLRARVNVPSLTQSVQRRALRLRRVALTQRLP